MPITPGPTIPGFGIMAASSLTLSGFLSSSSLTSNGLSGNTPSYYISGVNKINDTTGAVSISSILTNYVSLYASFIVASGVGFTINSDERIKKNIEYLSSAKSLELIKSMKPCSFEYVDFMKGKTAKYGYLAQDVETMLPNVVYTNPDYIPNFYEMVKIEERQKIILESKTTESLAIGTKLKFYDIQNVEIWREVQSIIDERSFTVTESFQEGTETLFLYGQEVADYRSIDTDQINAVLLSAFQETSKKIKDREKKIVELKRITEGLRKDLDAFISRN